MTRRPSADAIVEALRDHGCRVVERPGWRTRGTRYSLNPVGQVNHHDAFTEAVSDRRALEMAEQGRPDLSGPLCNEWIDSDSTVYLVAYGNANHAGYGEADVLDRVKRDLAPLGDARADPDRDSIVGNSHYWGREVRNAGTGRDPYEQLDAMVRANAAIADVHGWTANRSIAHREHTARKPDPAGIDMAEFRRLIAVRLAGAPPVKEGTYMYAAIVSALKVLYRYPFDEGAWDDGQRAAAEWWYGVAREHGEPNAIAFMHADARKLGLLPAAA